MFTLTVDDATTYHALRLAPGAFSARAFDGPFGFIGTVSFLERDQLVHALSLLPTDELIGVPK